ncbi:hypothetical protein KIN_03300 [Litoreibacter roseus]|uniref:Uncharacterized protein n=2 Tax=Litoreibacter roseus TaxID=2601869 RepID=A0A6N6JAU6_9RHOB|nr:hypothetical protein KIN_03300 [Litoreibacter roseus]
MLFETVCMAGLGNPAKSTSLLESSDLERISDTSEGGTRYFSEPNWIYAVTGTTTSEFVSLGKAKYDYCYVTTTSVSVGEVEEIQSLMAEKYIGRTTTYSVRRNSSRTTLRAEKPVAGRKVYIVSGPKPTQTAGPIYSSIELQQIR